MRKQIVVSAFPLKFQAALSQIAPWVSNDGSCEVAFFYFVFPELLFDLTAAKMM